MTQQQDKCCATIPQRIYQVSISFSRSDLMKKNLSKSHFILLTPSHRKNRREKIMFGKSAGAGFELSTAKINNTLSTNLTPQSTDPNGFLQPPAVCSLSGLRQPAGHILIWAQLKQLISFSSTIQTDLSSFSSLSLSVDSAVTFTTTLDTNVRRRIRAT